jgi:hypothetical protein
MIRMVKVSIRVHSGAAHFDVAVLADSPEQAINLIRARYRTSDVRLKLWTALEQGGDTMG